MDPSKEKSIDDYYGYMTGPDDPAYHKSADPSQNDSEASGATQNRSKRESSPLNLNPGGSAAAQYYRGTDGTLRPLPTFALTANSKLLDNEKWDYLREKDDRFYRKASPTPESSDSKAHQAPSDSEQDGKLDDWDIVNVPKTDDERPTPGDTASFKSPDEKSMEGDRKS